MEEMGRLDRMEVVVGMCRVVLLPVEDAEGAEASRMVLLVSLRRLPSDSNPQAE